MKVGRGLRAGKGAFRIFRIGFFALFLIYILITIITTAIVEKDAMIVIERLGEEFVSPLQQAQELSAVLVDDVEQGFFKSAWDYLSLYSNLYKVFLWIWVLVKIFNFFFQGTTPPIARVSMALITFFMISCLFSLLLLNQPFNTPLIASKEIIRNISYLFVKP